MMYLLLLLVLYVILTTNVTSVTFLFSVLVLLLYVIPYVFLWNDFLLGGLVSRKYLEGFSLLVLLCYLCFIVGSAFGSGYNGGYLRQSQQFKNRTLHIDVSRYENYSILVGLIGVAGYGFFILNSGISVYLSGHGSGDFSVGGYVYELRYFVFSAVLLLYNSYLLKSNSGKGLFFLCVFTLLLVVDGYLQQQRGSWIRLGIIFFMSFLLQDRSLSTLTLVGLARKYRVIFVSGLFLGLVLVFSVQLRIFYSPNKTFSDQIVQTTIYIYENPDVLFGGSAIDEGSEFVTAFNGYHAAVKSNSYDYGYKWLYPFLNFVPRNLWDDKPMWESFSINIFDQIDRYSSIIHAPASAETGVIDSFYRFSWFAPFFFFVIGFYLKRLEIMSFVDFRYRYFYICLFIGMFYFFAQNMFPCIVFTLYMYMPVYIVTSLCVRIVNLRFSR